MDASIGTLTQTVLGSLVVLLAGAVFYLFKLLIREKDARRTDALEMGDKMTTALQQYGDVTSLLANKIKVSKKTGGR